MNNIYLDMDFDYLVEGLTGKTLVPVTNMSRKKVSYIVEEMHIERDFREFIDGQTPDTKSIPFGELFALNNLPGGRQLIWDNLKIDSNDARKALELPLAEEAPEVDYSRKDVVKILSEGTDDEVLDMIEFGPYYIMEWIKEEAISIDSSKRRQFIGKILKINVDGLEENVKWAAEDPQAQGYQTIKGIDATKASTQGRRRAGAQVSSAKEDMAPKRKRRA